MLSPCGVSCDGCKDYKKSCAGCKAISGKVYWAEFIGSDICPIYDCCINQKSFEHCGYCKEVPCQIYYDNQDPSITTEEHRDSIKQRVNLLKNMMSI